MVAPIINNVLVVATIILWTYVTYQFVLTIFGIIYLRRVQRSDADTIDPSHLPAVTILVPAHNEEKVIERTIQSLLALDYPPDRLDILVVNDASTDSTPEILDRLVACYPRVRVVHRTTEVGGRGKSAVLNHALAHITREYIAVYDADNRPEPAAVKALMSHFANHPELGAVVGKFRTGNRRRNLLTRFINIEGLSYQGIIQSGRCQLYRIAMLTGTNYIIRRSVVEQVGGWDEKALTEDAELSMRVYEAGYRIAYIPNSVSWEQEPETLRVWIKQRTRWSRGNIYLMGKLFRHLPTSPRKFVVLEMIFMFSLPFFLFYTFFASQLGIVIALGHIEVSPLVDKFHHWWIPTIILYYLEVLAALSFDREITPENAALGVAAYFSYCQIWMVPLLLAVYAEFIRRQPRAWNKTIRFDTPVVIDTSAVPEAVLPIMENRESTYQPLQPVESGRVREPVAQGTARYQEVE